LILEKDFLFRRYNKELAGKLPVFDCGDEDLNAFFQEDAFNYDAQLLGRSYCFLSALEGDIAAIFTLSNSAIRVAELPNNAKRRLVKLIPWVKQGRNYPAVLIGRLGVSRKYRNQKIGSQIIDFIKAWFLSNHNKTGCRFVVVDAYNKEDVLHFYSNANNKFSFLFKEESQEKLYNSIPADENLKTRQMYFDLATLL
jgi:GNAT superfamily N-acetyltransferase